MKPIPHAERLAWSGSVSTFKPKNQTWFKRLLKTLLKKI